MEDLGRSDALRAFRGGRVCLDMASRGQDVYHAATKAGVREGDCRVGIYQGTMHCALLLSSSLSAASLTRLHTLSSFLSISQVASST
jgi:hypothetical protein